LQRHEYARQDALGLAALVRSGQVSPAELVAAAREVIAAHNPVLNAVIADMEFEPARAMAAPDPAAPFAGVPFLAKDFGIHFAGELMEMGSRLTAGTRLPHDTVLAARVRAAGFITIGRTNLPEFANNVATAPVSRGATRNPWDPERTPGGSSGGSAAAVASGMVPIAYADDGGGSIRAPAACCGLVGLKPTRGRVSWAPDFDEVLYGMASAFAVTRTVRDAAAFLDCVHGPAPGDRFLLPAPAGPFQSAIERPPGRLRIAWSARGLDGAPPFDGACVAELHRTVRMLEDLGHELVEAHPPGSHAELVTIFLNYVAAMTALNVDTVCKMTGRIAGPDTIEHTNLKLYAHGGTLKGADILATAQAVNTLARNVAPFFEQNDLWLTPTLSSPPVALDQLNANDPRFTARGWVEEMFRFAPVPVLCNVTGRPAISLPVGESATGLPIGMHFIGRLGSEDMLLALGRQLEDAMPWRDRTPALFG
jgi:amidase